MHWIILTQSANLVTNPHILFNFTKHEDTSSILDKILNFIDWIITFCSGKYVETFHALRTEIEIQKLGFLLDV